MPHACCKKRRFMKFHVCAVVVSTRDGTMYTHFAKNLKFIDILFWAREVPMLKFHNAKWIMQMIEFQCCKTLILMIHALVLAWYENHKVKTRLRAREIPMLKFHYAKWIMKSIAIQWRIQNRKNQNPKRKHAAVPGPTRDGSVFLLSKRISWIFIFCKMCLAWSRPGTGACHVTSDFLLKTWNFQYVKFPKRVFDMTGAFSFFGF